jgi:hypothetical protein
MVVLHTRHITAVLVQVSLQMKVLQSPTDILGPMDQDVLISWIMLIMSTAQQLGVARTAAGLEAAGATTGAAPAAGPANQDLSDTSMPAAGASSGAGPSQSSGAGQPTAAGTTAAAAAAAADPITQRFSGQVLGLLQYVKNTLNMYQQQEYTLQRLQSLQATVNQEQQRSQFLDLMQQYTRLVLITVEVVAAQQLPTTFPLTNPHTLRSPSGYTASIWPDLLSPAGATPAGSSSSSSASSATAAAGGGSSEAHGPPLSAARACALRLLMAWMGAVLGSSYSRQRFVALALEAYTAGYAAGDLYSQIADEEYSQTGGLIPLPSQPQMVVEVNAQLFGQWLSCCYLTWAQLGVSFPGAADQTGWAWAGAAVTANFWVVLHVVLCTGRRGCLLHRNSYRSCACDADSEHMYIAGLGRAAITGIICLECLAVLWLVTVCLSQQQHVPLAQPGPLPGMTATVPPNPTA